MNSKTNIILGTKSCTYRENENLLSGKKQNSMLCGRATYETNIFKTKKTLLHQS